MFADTRALLAPALVGRLVLLINHVLASEPHASLRLLPHQGRVLRVVLSDWPSLLPAAPVLAFRITPAGLLEWVPEVEQADLLVRVPAGNPLALAASVLTQAMAGAGGGSDAAGRAADEAAGVPASLALDIEGDARLATDIDWLAKNLRWDLAADLERLFGPIAAHQLTRWGRALVQALARLRAAAPGVGSGVGQSGLAPGAGLRSR